jgi:peptidoglycan/LPS O-acetylase OafA/YrhL
MSGIDGLRAIAVGAVFAYHADRSWLPGGFLGVDVFFVISGYLITSLLLAELAATGRVALGEFWARRARRLLPALFVLLAVCLVVGATVERGRLAVRGDALAAIFYVANWRFVFEHHSYFEQFGRPPLLRHLWSLAVEEQFYLVWPLLLVLGMRFARRGLPLLVAAAAVASTGLMWVLYRPGADPSRVFYGTDTRAAPLLVGVLLAFVWRPGALPGLPRRFGRAALDALSVLALAAVAAAFVAVHDNESALYRGGFLVLAVCAALLLATVVHPASGLGWLLARPLPRWLGERSYAIYLWHWPVLVFTRPGVDVQVNRAVLLVFQVGATLLLAELSYRLVERPVRSGALDRLWARRGGSGARLQATFVAAGLAAAGLLGLAALTPQSMRLPPGFTASALAASQRSDTRLLRLPPRTLRPQPAALQTRRVGSSSSRPRFPRSGPILAVGDSVMLGASDALREALGQGLRVDAVVSRQADELIDRLFAYRAAGTLPRRVIVHVGDNGPVYYAQWQRLKTALAGVPLVVFVNVRVDRPWQSEVNREEREAVASWRQATIADWYRASAAPGSVVDGTHTSPHGAALYAAVIRHALRSPLFRHVSR